MLKLVYFFKRKLINIDSCVKKEYFHKAYIPAFITGLQAAGF